MNQGTIFTNITHKVATISFFHPASNSLPGDLLNRLTETFNRLDTNLDVNIIVLKSDGEKAFCAGADLKERTTLSDIDVKRFILSIRELSSSIDNLNKPVIAAINGVALGGGMEIALACDIRIASENAIMGLTETRLAIIPGGGGTQRLPRLIGAGKAKELIFTGRRVKAKEALAISLVNSICSKELLIDECFKMAEMIKETGPIAVEQAKYAINYGLETDLRTGLAIESNAYWITIPTKDRLEGLAAFREKRKPVFKGE